MKKEIIKPVKNNDKHQDDILEAIIAYNKVIGYLKTQLQPSKSYLRKDKNESKNLTTQFRETIRELFNDTSLREIRERIQQW
jgi:hypothetical protein